AWVGYEEKPNITSKETWLKTDYVDKKFINLAKKMGYLIGAYDSYHTMQPPEKVDSYNTDFGTDFYTKGCVRNKDGKIASGFAGRGCSVSMTALEQTGNFIINDRIKKFKADGINSYFLDCHGMLEGYDDYDLAHSQTILTDIAIRLGHLKYLSDQHLVLGSEAATAYAIPFLAFSHGNFGTLFNIHYRFMKDKNLYGGWGPARKPAIFFKSIKANDKYAMRYDPQYRLPMLQAVFHESIVTTDRWDTPLTKFTNLYTDRFILEFIYGVPSIWNLDIATVRGYKNILQQLVKEFTPLHRKIMTEELTHFEYLSLDRLIQKTMFGDNKVIMIGNLKNEAFEDIPAKSIKIFLPDTNEVKIITPEKLRSF
ncbi:MAG: glycoside hydrolase, partial [Janthinobacterium lividum]